MDVVVVPLLKGIIIAKSDQHLSDLWLKLWILGEWRCMTVRFGSREYILLDAVDIGDFVELSKSGGPIRKLPPAPTLPETREIRNCLKVRVNFVPLDYLLFPASAKGKNFRMAMTAELGPIPLTNQNNYMVHCVYKGVAKLFFEKNVQQQRIEEVYQTLWLICDGDSKAAELDTSTIVQAFDICQNLRVEHQGLVVDASLKDVFFVHCAELPELVSLRKDITGGRIGIGDWLRFIVLDVREAEKNDDSKMILPDSEHMSFFNRRIACCPVKIEPVFRTSTSGGRIQLVVAVEVPLNPSYSGTYSIDRLGKVGDQKGLVGVKHEGRTISVSVQCKVNIEVNRANFNICDIEMERQKPSMPPPVVVPTASAPTQFDTFLQSIERAQHQQKQQPRLTHPSANIITNVNNSSGRRAEVPMTDENADPNNANSAFRHHQQPPLSHNQPEPITPPALRRKPTNCIELDTIVVESVKGPGGSPLHVLCFCFDCSQKPNNYIIRIGLNEIDKLPTPGQWVRVVMKQEVHGKRVDYSLWEAQTMTKGKHETDFVVENGVSAVLVRAPLKVTGNGFFYNQSLGPVSDIGKRLKIPSENHRQVNAWCRKVMPISICSLNGLCHWEIAVQPEEEWQDEHLFKLPAESKTIFKIPFVGSRYRSQPPQQLTTTPQPSQQQQTMAISKPNKQQQQQNNISGQRVDAARLSPASSGFGSSNSSSASVRVERDLIDLFDEKCSIGPLNCPTPPTPLRPYQSGAIYPHTGVIASVNLKSSGYYVYSNEFDTELYLLTEELLEKGCWIKFNIIDNPFRPSIGDFALMKRSPFDVRVERNTIYMCVNAVINSDALAHRVINTSYVKNVYDQHRLLNEAHVGSVLKLEVVRGKVSVYCWAISKIMKIGN